MAPSTAEVIASARYLDDDFDPRSLTIPHLNGILSHHGVRFPSNAKKAVLVNLFEEKIVGNLDELRRERNFIDGSVASDRGITDGLTGEQVGVPDASHAD
jgi:HeH/LEM domain